MRDKTVIERLETPDRVTDASIHSAVLRLDDNLDEELTGYGTE
jgi:hypothetical protein